MGYNIKTHFIKVITAAYHHIAHLCLNTHWFAYSYHRKTASYLFLVSEDLE